MIWKASISFSKVNFFIIFQKSQFCIGQINDFSINQLFLPGPQKPQ